MPEPGSDNRVRLGFERQTLTLPIVKIVALKSLREGVRVSKKFLQIVSSIKAIGLVEAPAVVPDPQDAGQYFLLDGQLRIEALKQLGIETVDCLIANDDETYTYNKRVNRLPPISAGTMGDAALRGGSSMAVGMAANPQGAHQVGRHRDRPHAGLCPNVGDGRAWCWWERRRSEARPLIRPLLRQS
jgi:ParB-like nuclease domain